MPNLSDATEIRLGATPVREVYLGDKLVWPTKLLHWVFDFETPNKYIMNVPQGAKYVYYWLSGGGAAGEDGNGAVNRAGLGGSAGEVKVGVLLLGVSVKTIEVTIGAGGQPNNQRGGFSSLTLGTPAEPGYYQVTTDNVPPSPTSANRDGGTSGFSSSQPFIVLLINKVPGMVGDGKIQVINGGLRNGPGGTNGGSGMRGGGGSGGAGGIFGNFKRGGVGGDGFCRLVFTNKMIE